MARQGLFQRKGGGSMSGSMTTNPSPMADGSGSGGGKKPSVGATGAASDSAPVRTSNTGSQGPGDQGTAEDDQGSEMVQCPNCGCQFDAEDPTNPESYVPPEQAPDGSPSQMTGSSSGGGNMSNMSSDISAMLGGLSGGGSASGGMSGAQ